MNLIQLTVSLLLYFVIFFGIAFILNMLLRKTWLMALIYPIIIIIIINDSKLVEYFTKSKAAFSSAWQTILALQTGDVIILLAGFAGTVVSGIIIKFLRKTGYQMF